jgi:hypothetical protein
MGSLKVALPGADHPDTIRPPELFGTLRRTTVWLSESVRVFL